MIIATFLLLVVLGCTLSLVNSVPLSRSSNDLDGDLMTPRVTIASTYMANLTRRHGYPPMERHQTETQDGYILTMYLIPQKNEKRFSSKTVFLSHGMLSSSDCWFFNDPQRILPFKMHDLGYNVMLGNFRGSSHSPNHTTLPNHSSSYWDFSWDEIGREDVGAMIDYTLNVTQQKQLTLIGHSMGTTTAFVLLSEKPEYNEKIYKFIALAPAVFHAHSTSPLRLHVAPLLNIWGSQKMLNLVLSPGKLPPDQLQMNDWRRKLGPQILKIESDSEDNETTTTMTEQSLNVTQNFELLIAKIVKRILYHAHISVENLGKETFKTLLSSDLEVVSLKSLFHYAQGMNYGTFQRFDYSGVSNLFTYGSWSAPTYNLSKVTCPVSLFWSDNDPFSEAEDIKMLQDALTGSRDLDVFELEKSWTHMDYLFSKRADKVLIPPVVKCLK